MAKLQTVAKKESKTHSVITVKLEGGLVQWVEIPENVQVAIVVVDYDVDGSLRQPDRDENGEDCRISIWKNQK